MILHVDEEGYFYYSAGLGEHPEELDPEEPIEPDAPELSEREPVALPEAAE